MSDRHERTQAHLPHLVDGSLPRWRRPLVQRHLGRCEVCSAERVRQEALAAGFEQLRAMPVDAPPPPDDLLDTILDQVQDPGMRARLASPARGAVSGARPELSVAAALVTLGVLYLMWRALRRALRLAAS